MSLLIKALNKAEEAQAQNIKTEAQAQNAKTEQTQAENAKAARAKQKPTEKAKVAVNATKLDNEVELSLSPSGSVMTAPDFEATANKPTIKTPSQVPAPVSAMASSKNAANVFSAKGLETNNNKKIMAAIAGAGLLGLLGIGVYYYQIINHTPDIAVPPRPLTAQVAPPATLSEIPPSAQLAEASASMVNQAAIAETLPAQPAEAHEAALPVAAEADETVQVFQKQDAATKKPTKKTAKKLALSEDEEVVVADNAVDESEPPDAVANNKKAGRSKTLQFGEAIASKSASISVTKSTPSVGVNPTLMHAYEAYNAGKDAEAQKLYKQVLQHDVRSVDALLGLAAIASRQGREADANGWYGKVLEVDPRNSLAQSALLAGQAQGNALDNESRLKNMLAKQPEDANLHASLGDLYAEQNQWPAAQQAYFDAYRLNGSAENALNLAVSLDQMGKPKLALPYYQRALEQASSTSNIDKAALQARISAIQ